MSKIKMTLQQHNHIITLVNKFRFCDRIYRAIDQN
jgi:hypothetical protein